jgi:hypothetical protein
VEKDSEVIETLDWLNQKLTQYQYENNDVKQVFHIKKIEEVQEEYFLICYQEQWLNNSQITKKIIKIPISKINNHY